MHAADIVAGRYRLTHKLGAGGLGEVWAAQAADGEVAIKFLKSQDADPTTLRRFVAEAEAMRQLSHPNIVRVFEAQVGTGHAFIVMERVDGVALYEFMRDPLPGDVAAHLIRQIVGALEHAHARGIVHRDLKPGNILVADQSREVKVIDFGLAKFVLGEQSDFTKTGEFLGTPQYMSPEQLRGARSIGPPTDMYALGVLLYQMLEGRLPFQGSMLEVGMAHLTQEAPPLSPRHPAYLRELTIACLSKEASHRPTSAHAARCLDEQRYFRPSAHTMPAATKRTSYALAAALGALILGVVWVLVSSPAPPPAQPAPTRRAVAITKTAVPLTEPPPPANEVDLGVTPEAVPPLWDATPNCERQHKPGVESRSRYAVRTPKGYRPTPRPLLVLLQHDRDSFEKFLDDTGFDELADKHGFIITGFPAAAQLWRPADNLAVIQEAVAGTFATHCVDPARVFVLGHRVGGGPATILGCSQQVAAVAITAYLPDVGTRWLDTCVAPAPALLVLPRDTAHVPVGGGPRSLVVGNAMSHADFEARLNDERNCATEEVELLTYRHGQCTRWDCAQPFESCSIAGGAQWPGTQGQDGPFDNPPSSFPTSERVWDFFSRHGDID